MVSSDNSLHQRLFRDTNLVRTAISLLTLCLALLEWPASAQQLTPGPAQQESSGQAFDRTPENEPSPVPGTRPKYQLTRWLEDWRALADPATRTGSFDQLKYIPLGSAGNAHFTLSGQLREDGISNNGSILGKGGDTYGLHRLYIGADLHIAQARVFIEFADTLPIAERGPPGPTDKDALDLQLLFADYRLDVDRGSQLIGRLGRQELQFDPTQRFVGVREGPNNRQAFDAIRLNFKSIEFYVSAFASRPVTYKPGVFDDARAIHVAFSGLYATHLADGQTQSFYVYDYANDAARFGNFSGREQRTAFGSRMAGQLDGFDYDLEGMVQTGRFSGQQIRAWGVGSIAGYTFGYVPLAPRIGVQADFASGDRNPNDGRLTTFNPLFFKGAYFLEAPISSFANVRHLKASLSLRPTAADTVNFAIGDFEKMSAADAIYATPLIALVPTRAMHGRHVGRYFQAIASHQFGPQVSLTLEYDHFVRSTALAAVGGRDIDFGKLTANFLF